MTNWKFDPEAGDVCALEVSKKLKLYKYRVARYVRTKIEQVCKQGKKRANKQVSRFLV